MTDLTKKPAWMALKRHQIEIAPLHMRDWFLQEPDRFKQFSLQNDEMVLDYSRNRIQQKTLNLLFDFARSSDLSEKITALFTGHSINHTEKRPALHTALRAKDTALLTVNGEEITVKIQETRAKMQAIVEKIHNKQWLGATGKPIRHIVNVGIGGSHHGPYMATHALKEFAVSDLQFHFVSTVDHTHLQDVLEHIDAETTLFIISSKSFTTLETLTNAHSILNWLKHKLPCDGIAAHHFIAVTSAIEKAINFGIQRENILPIWDWVGGRYSIWSAIGLPLMLMIGNKHFMEFLEGAYQMDSHFRDAPYEQNMPVILALLNIWYTHFFNANATAIIPYSHRLHRLVAYLQQAEMESNGKSVNSSGHAITYATSPIVFGEEGCNGQHTYHQLLHQGKLLVPADFILIGNTNAHVNHHQDILFASGLSQAQALMQGKTYQEAYAELKSHDYSDEEAATLAYHQVIPGNRPSNILFLQRLTPKNLGALIALYEHKIFVQAVLLNINPFDQWGVELGKQLLPTILNNLTGAQSQPTDCATESLIKLYKSLHVI